MTNVIMLEKIKKKLPEILIKQRQTYIITTNKCIKHYVKKQTCI